MLGGVSYYYNCPDFSDQVFQMNKTCTEDVVDTICKVYEDTMEPKMRQICNNRTIPCTKEQEMKNDRLGMSDAHFCQKSCLNPGSNCLACTNPDYFNCSRSGLCVHPELLCDGHPQCPHAEDEDFDFCYEKLLKRGDIKDTATLRCRSIMYPGKISDFAYLSSTQFNFN